VTPDTVSDRNGHLFAEGNVMERDLSQEATERLLGGDLMPPPEGAERLAALLAAAAAPASPDELAGEAAAMAAFRAHPPTVRRRSLRSALTLKVAAVVAATVAAGGVALASGTGLLPNPFQPSPDGSQSPTGPSSKDHSPATGVTPSIDGHADPTEALRGLCRSYQGKPVAERKKVLQSPPFEALVHEAGNAERVDAYCAKLLANPEPVKSKDGDPNRTPPAQPTPPTPPVTRQQAPTGPPNQLPPTPTPTPHNVSSR
jgi:hypothetical protein